MTPRIEGKDFSSWPTPRVSDTEGAVAKGVEKQNGNYSRKNKKGVRWGVKLKDAVDYEEKQKMWPTPKTSDMYSAHMKENKQGVPHDVAKGNLRGTVQMYPTPKARDWKDSGSIEKLAETKSQESLMHRVAKQMFLTPTANEDAAGRPGTKMQKMLGNHPEVRNKGEGTLNADWVEWLMGYPPGWTNLPESPEQDQASKEELQD